MQRGRRAGAEDMQRSVRQTPGGTPRLLAGDRGGLEEAVRLLAAGGLVAFPTETVYGLGADACSADAVARVYAAKDRPPENPLIVHVATLAEAESLVDIPETLRGLAKTRWPGPLTLALPRQEECPVAPAASAGLDTLAVRVPEHSLALSLLRRFGGPLVGPSANPSGRVSPTQAAHVLSDMGGRVDAVLDGGPCELGVESSIVGLENGVPVLLRSGALDPESLAAALGQAPGQPSAASRPLAPGSYPRHYAPRATLRLDAQAPMPGEAWLGFGPDPPEAEKAAARASLSAAGDPKEAARNLYACLRDLDARASRIAVASVPAGGAGEAVRDRLRRAAAPAAP